MRPVDAGFGSGRVVTIDAPASRLWRPPRAALTPCKPCALEETSVTWAHAFGGPGLTPKRAQKENHTFSRKAKTPRMQMDDDPWQCGHADCQRRNSGGDTCSNPVCARRRSIWALGPMKRQQINRTSKKQQVTRPDGPNEHDRVQVCTISLSAVLHSADSRQGLELCIEPPSMINLVVDIFGG